MHYTLWVSVSLLLAEAKYSSEKYINYKNYQTGRDRMVVFERFRFKAGSQFGKQFNEVPLCQRNLNLIWKKHQSQIPFTA